MSRYGFLSAVWVILYANLGHAQADKETGPRLVTIQGDNLTVAEALSQLSKQTSFSVEDRRRKKDPRPFKLQLKNVPFWQAFDTIAKEADANVSLYERDGIPSLIDGPHVVFPISYHGIFRMALKRLVNSLDLETGARRSVATIEIAWEPPYRPFLLETRPKKLLIHGEKNQEIAVKDDGGGQAPVEGKLTTLFEVNLPFVPRPETKLNLIQGEIALVGASRMLTFSFGSLEELQKEESKRTQTVDGVTVKVTKLQLADDLWTAEMVLEYPPGGPKFESFQSWLVNNEIYLKKQKGEMRLSNNAGYSLESSSSNRAVLRYYFKDDKTKGIKRGNPGDWLLHYVTPGVISETVVPFSFKDVPLP
jgi:hypothetical protein